MSNAMIIVIIPAKGQSRRLPNKNMFPIIKKPMIDYTIEHAKKSEQINDIYVSTDSPEVKDYCKQKEIKIINRSSELCGDTPIIDVYRHAYNYLSHLNINILVGLQPDHPDRTIEVDNALNVFKEKKLDLLSSKDNNNVKNGSYYILSKDVIEGKEPFNTYSIIDHCTNVHFEEDIIKAEINLQKT